MRYILIILIFLSLGADAQMIIKAHANYRPLVQPAANLLLDDYPNAAAAYSLRKLDKDYTGSAIRVRRSNDNTEQDIGFTSSGDLDTASLKTFVGANNGFVTTWYDQSGNARNATQGTAANQPNIIVSGSLLRNPVNNKIVIQFNYSNNQQLLTSNQTFSGDITMFGTYNMFQVPNLKNEFSYGIFSYGEEANAKRRSIIIWNGGSGNTWYHYASGFAQNVQIAQATAPTNSLVYSLFNYTSQQISGGYNGGAAVTASRTLTNPAASPIRIGSTGSENSNSNIYEVILYNSNQSSNRTGIETNINTHYSIY